MRQKIKIAPNTPTNESGLIQLIMMGESIRQIWVNLIVMRGVEVSVMFWSGLGFFNLVLISRHSVLTFHR